MRALIASALLSLPLVAQEPAGPDADTEGFLPFHWDAARGRIHFVIDHFDQEFLYAISIASGLGSNPIGLDRGSLGPQHVVVWRKVGPRVFLVARNLRFRAQSEAAAERRAVRESFAESVLWGFDLVEDQAGRITVDATDFVLRDAAGIARRVKSAGSGSYRLDASRSALYLPRTKAFPDNTEVEVTLTFHSDEPGREVRRTAATGEAFTVRQRHSFIRLPNGFAPRLADPRVGYFGVDFLDYASPLDRPMHRRFIARHRLQKRDPTKAVDEVVEPIVYHLDPGVPEPVRSALKEGASWWARAFEAAGFRNAFRIEDLPDGADALDVRFNVIHWVHRATRGWSYGASIIDPRTGEILKGNVLLGSLRVRQDHLLFAGLSGPWNACAAGAAPGHAHLLPASDPRQVELSLARIRQLAAHEVGHTLGLSHNFAASSHGRSSVMDYPAPWVRARDGELDFGEAYAVGIGAYDRWAIRYGYTQFAPGTDQAAALDALVREGLAQGYVLLDDHDARAASTFRPGAALWDNGADPIAELRNAIEVRRLSLARFGLANLPDGAPLADLEPALLPLMLHWRYQLEAALKLVGGVEYVHAVKGDGQPGPRSVAPRRQIEAVLAALSLLAADELTVPERIRALIPPPSPIVAPNAERFPRTAGIGLDPVDVALVQADLVVSGLLERSRAARLSSQGLVFDDREFGFADVARMLVEASCGAPPAADPTERAVQRAVMSLVVDRLMQRAADGRARADVRAAARDALAHVRRIDLKQGPSAEDAAHAEDLLRRIRMFLDGVVEAPPRRTPTIEVPQGMPIGSGR